MPPEAGAAYGEGPPLEVKGLGDSAPAETEQSAAIADVSRMRCRRTLVRLLQHGLISFSS